MWFQEQSSQPFMCFLHALPVVYDQVICMQVSCWFPCVVAVWIAFPFDQELERACPPEVPVVHDLLHLILVFSAHEVGGRPGEVWSVG
jgi:hypothetical protein